MPRCFCQIYTHNNLTLSVCRLILLLLPPFVTINAVHKEGLL